MPLFAKTSAKETRNMSKYFITLKTYDWAHQTLKAAYGLGSCGLDRVSTAALIAVLRQNEGQLDAGTEHTIRSELNTRDDR